jgi:hypothetical protein
MAYNFKECNRDQVYLMPPTLQEWPPPTDLDWHILDAVAQMDLMVFCRKFRQDGKGQAAFISRTGVLFQNLFWTRGIVISVLAAQ